MINRAELYLPGGSNYWENKNITENLKKISRYSLTLIEGRSGYGKTKQVAKFFHKNYPKSSYWYSLKSKTDIFEFWEKLVSFLEVDYADKFERAKKIITQFKVGEIQGEEFIESLIKVLADFEKDIFLVVDNFELISLSNDFCFYFELFIDMLENNFHLIIINQGYINYPKFDYWELMAKAMKIEDKEFILDSYQIEELLLLEYKLCLSKSEIRQIKEISEGWILVVDLIARRVKEGVGLEEILNDKASFKVIFTYLKYEVLDKLSDDPTLKEFLLKTSILRNLNTDICNKLLEIDNSQEIIQELINRGVFIYKEEKNIFRYHNIFQSFLREEANDFYDMKSLQQRVREVYEELNFYEDLAYHVLDTEEDKEIINLINKNADRWLANKEFNLLEKCLDHLSEDKIASNPRLLIYQGNLYLKNDEIDNALRIYLRAEDMLVNEEDELMIKVLFKIAKIYSFLMSRNLLVYIDKLNKFKESFSEAERRELLYLRIIENIIDSNLKEAEKRLADDQVEEEFYKELKAYICLIKGNSKECQELIDSLELEDKSFCDYRLSYTITLPVVIRLIRGEKYEALEYIWNKKSNRGGLIEEFFKYYLSNVYEFLGLKGYEDLKNSYLNFKAVLDSKKLNLFWHEFELRAKSLLADSFYGKGGQSIENCLKDLKLLEERNYKFLSSMISRVIATSCYFKGDRESCSYYLEESKDKLMSLNNRMYLASTLLLLALVNYKDENKESCYKYLRQGLEIIKEEGCDQLLIKSSMLGFRDPNRIIPMLIEAKKNNIESEYINKILKKIDLASFNRAPGYSLKIKAFGRFELYRDKYKVDSSEWKRKNARELFKLFLVNYDKMIPRDRICDILWPDKDQKSAVHSFNVSLNSLNKILEPDRKSRTDSYFIVKEGLNYGLSNQFSYFYDVKTFEELIERGNKARDEIIRINYYKKAVDLYQGDFLAGDLYSDFITRERERLENLFLEVADEVLAYYYDNQEYKASIKLANRILKIDKFFERAYLYKMKSYDQINRREFAIKTYQVCKKVLEEDLNISPNSNIENYYHSIII
ncbi:BTAD domain-containing putative transcriptional regulator [Orenia marismortui]|uniref:ATP/maltotriose-dependent transcriptional regulator MalT n=1 Tax=Orenia marismortui TaxID=46469 RepID=A0A4R8HA88_9FIRM|nr:BTAD domain-containing putative transcriptional regulator [Orenia marismortui]TDX53203.1 ATP/maltotriose-dependent transcriptional regulator MalT [Orenia marismortui]